MIRLEKEEIEDACGGGVYQAEDYYRDGANHQAKKIIRFYSEYCEFQNRPRRECGHCWQFLIEEFKKE